MINFRNSQILLRVLVLGTTSISASYPLHALAQTQEVKAGEGICTAIMTPDTLIVDESQILAERYSLYDLVTTEAGKNLAYKHPSIVMNAFQRLASWIWSGGVKQIPSPNYGSNLVNHFSIFSDGVEAAKGKLIVGQYEQIQAFVDYVMAGANGDGSASKMPVLAGPPGTGKSEFLTILNNIAQFLSATSPDHYIYTYEWKELKDIAALRPFLNLDTDMATGRILHEHPLVTSTTESPFLILPKAYQKPVLEFAKARAIEVSKAIPTPAYNLNPQSAFVRDEILKDYMQRNNLTSMTAAQQLEVLSMHVVIRRKVIGKAGDIAKINAEGKDVDYSGLFMAPNALILNTYGQSHPFSYYLNGKILRANGGMLQLDEFFRNVPELRDTFLEVIENRVVARGGAPVFNLDAVIIGASNNSSINAAKAQDAGSSAGGSEKGSNSAHVDRVRLLPMTYQLNPYEIGKTMLLMKNQDNLLQMKLSPYNEQTGFGDVKMEPANLSEIFPVLANTATPLGPDGRYAIWANTGPTTEPVHLSPHALMYMAMTVGASRLETSVNQAMKFMPNAKVINSAAFQDVVTRMKILTNAIKIEPAERAELAELSSYLEEGSFGISARDAANVWLNAVIDAAKLPGNDNCVTPLLAKKVLDRLIAKNEIQFPNNKARLQAKNLSDLVMNNFIVPAIQSDINATLGSGLGDVKAIYEEVYRELSAISIDQNAEMYEAENGEAREINRKRLEEIFEIYKRSEGRTFLPQEVIASRAISLSKDVRHQGLLRAIEFYLAKRTTETLSYEDIARAMSGEGSQEIRAKFSEIPNIMKHQHGYCPHCMKKALLMAKQAASRTQQQHNH